MYIIPKSKTKGSTERACPACVYGAEYHRRWCPVWKLQKKVIEANADAVAPFVGNPLPLAIREPEFMKQRMR